MIALQAAGTASPAAKRRMTRELIFASRCKGLRRGPAEKTGTRHCGKRSRRSRSWPRFARSRSRGIAPMQETMAIRTPLRSTKQRKASRAHLDPQHRSEDRGYEGGDRGRPSISQLRRKRAAIRARPARHRARTMKPWLRWRPQPRPRWWCSRRRRGGN